MAFLTRLTFFHGIHEGTIASLHFASNGIHESSCFLRTLIVYRLCNPENTRDYAGLAIFCAIMFIFQDLVLSCSRICKTLIFARQSCSSSYCSRFRFYLLLVFYRNRMLFLFRVLQNLYYSK